MPKTKALISFFDNAGEVLVLYDENLNIVEFNKAGLELFKFRKVDVIGKNISKVFPVLGQQKYCEKYLEVLKKGKPITIEDFTPHTSLGVFRFRIKVFKTEGLLGMVISNITDLAETVEELNALVYRLTHDMRTPIVNVLLLSDVLATQTKETKLDDDFSYISLTEIKKQAEKLDGILTKLQQIALSRSAQKKTQLVDFKATLSRITKYIDKVYPNENVAISTSIETTEPFYCYNKKMVLSVLTNLIENAVKYKSDDVEQSRIKVTIKSEKEGVLFVVEDNGIGIPKNLQKKVFTIFFRGTTKSMGAGLGLYSVQQDIKRANGTIKLESTEGQGTTFTVYLPSLKKSVDSPLTFLSKQPRL